MIWKMVLFICCPTSSETFWDIELVTGERNSDKEELKRYLQGGFEIGKHMWKRSQHS